MYVCDICRLKYWNLVTTTIFHLDTLFFFCKLQFALHQNYLK